MGILTHAAEKVNIDGEMIRRAVGIFGDPSHNLFLTALPSKRHACYSPHALDHICTFVESVSDGRSTYFGVNPVGHVYVHTTDADVIRRRWFFIDVDRNKDLQPNDPATDPEHDDAQAMGLDIAFCLRERGFPEPVFCDSGNGSHLYYRIDLPNDSTSRSLIASALTRLSESFAGDVRGDIGVECYDARRLSRLPGTWSRRGDESAERPYRMCRLVSVPATFEVVPAELLREIAGTPTKASPPAKSIPPLTASGSGEAARKKAYAKAAIDAEHAKLSSTAIGRNNRFWDAVKSLYGLVSGGIADESEVESAIESACRLNGLLDTEFEKTSDAYRRAKDKGMAKPRKMPPSRQQSSDPPSEPAGDDQADFPNAIVASALVQQAETTDWLWRGYIARRGITLFSALWKTGKTTLLAHLARNMGSGEPCCGIDVKKATVLYVSEESETRWANRRDALGIGDNVHFITRPFRMKPTVPLWQKLVAHVGKQAAIVKADLVAMDTLSALWPVKNENDAGEVQAALMPLWDISAHHGVLLVHHLKKGDGAEATGSRGSGALPGFVDTILELRRHEPTNPGSRKRVLTGYGRDEDTPAEVLVELDLVTGQYRGLGDRKADRMASFRQTALGILPANRPGLTITELSDAWPGESPTKSTLIEVMHAGAVDGLWTRDGTGKKGHPWRFVQHQP